MPASSTPRRRRRSTSTASGRRDLAEPPRRARRGDLDELLDDVDVAWVCTWTAAHLEAVRSRGRAGSGGVLREAARADARARRAARGPAGARCPHQVGLVLRHAPVFRAVAELVASGRYGRPWPRSCATTSTSRSRACTRRRGGPTSPRREAGRCIEHSIHDVDVLRWILGDPRSRGRRPHRVAVRSRGHRRRGYAHAPVSADGATATIVSVWHQILSRGRRVAWRCSARTRCSGPTTTTSGPLHVETTRGAEVARARAADWIDRLDGRPRCYAKPLAQYAEPSKAFLDATRPRRRPRPGRPDAQVALRGAPARGSGLPVAAAGTSASVRRRR